MNPMSQAKTSLNPKNYLATFIFILVMVTAAYDLHDREIILPEMAAIGEYAFPFLVFVFPPDSVMQLPIASCLMASFSLGYVYLYRTYFQHIAIEKSYS